jgi:NADH:ubiquinone oxidoreductase subunit 6 (subunit J)
MNKLSEKLVVASLTASGMLSSALVAGKVWAKVDVDLNKATIGDFGFATEASTVIETIFNIVFVVGAVIALFYLVMGAIGWITSGGDKTKTEAARNKITSAVIGLLILGAVFVIFTLVLGVFGKTPEDFIDIQEINKTT